MQLQTLSPGNGEVLVKVQYATVIALDTYACDRQWGAQEYPMRLGYNCTGLVAKVGQNVADLKEGDKVMGFAIPEYGAAAKTLQEYALLPQEALGKVPENITLQEATTFPDNFVTAYWTLFHSLRLAVARSLPATSPPSYSTASILVYGAGTTTGEYVIQLLALAGYEHVLATSSPQHNARLHALGVKHVFDYKLAEADLAQRILEAADGKIHFAVDCIATETSLREIAKVIGMGSVVAVLLPVKLGQEGLIGGPGSSLHKTIPKEMDPFNEGVTAIGTDPFEYTKVPALRDTLMSKILPELVKKELIKPNRLRLIDERDHPSLLDRVTFALDLYRKGLVRNEKIVVKVSD